MDSELVPLPLAPIAPILRVANEIRMDNPRVAYLCCFYAFEKIRLIDLTSRELGVRQFKTDLLHRLEKESIETKPQLAKNNDAKEILLYYQNFYEKYIKEGEHTTYPEEMAKLCEIATVLYEVLKAVAPPNQIDSQTQRIADDVKKKRDQYPHYNILPLYAPGIKPAIMELPEIEVAVKALRNIEDLPMPTKVIGDDDDRPAMPINDIFDWLSSIFGFQKGNVANQREHLILLLANINARHLNGIGNPEVNIQLSNLTIGQLEEKIFANYICWCKFLHCKPSTERFAGGYDKMQMKLVYISLFLLIWGEASNVRLLPECLCYIFHHMAKEIYVITYNNVHPVSGEAFESEVRDGEYFLRNIISPLYVVLDKETKRSRGGRESNSKWRNYDDFNEFFWTDKCFSLGWPMNPKSNFFRHYTAQIPQNKRSPSTTERSEPKANFVELRTFWHLYRNFDRMWIFLVLAFQALVIIAWNSRASLSSFFDPHVFASMLSIFVTYSFLNLLRATLDIALILSAWESLKTTHMVRLVLKFSTAAFWALASAFEYRSLVNHGTGLASFFNTKRSLYGLGVAIYLAPNLLDTLLFSIPSLRRAMYESKLWIITILLWWTQEPQLYVGRDMYESWCSQLKYTLFWVTLLISKLAFSYYVEMLPLVRPTKEIMGMSLDDYQWHELFPNADNLCVVIAIWAPIVLVYFMDVQIWYIIYSTLFGVIHGAINHLGEIRTMEILKSRSESLPFALTHSQIARQPTNENMLSLQQHQKSIFYFYIVWNELIISMRMEDLLSNRDRDLLLAPLDISSGISVFQWPPYLLASKISTAIDIAGNYRGRDDVDLFRRIKSDNYMNSAVIEFYEGLKGVLNTLFKNESDKMIVQSIFTKIEQSIQMKTFLNDFWTDALFSLSDRLEKLFTQLLSDDEEDESFVPRIVSALQDAMETVIHDFMINGRELLVRHDSRIKEERFGEICHSIICSESLKKMVKRLHIILTVRESAKFVPTNLEARRRITFFADSLYMNMPPAPKVRDMFSFSVLTPYYKEDVLYTDEEILKENKDGISIMFYMQKIYPDEWCNFMERIQGLAMYSNNEKAELTRQWVSCRGQTLFRTVRGIMYYREALELQYLLESIEHNATSHGYIALDSDSRAENKTIHKAAQALADLKFTYVVSCQIYDALKKSEDPRDKNCYRNILNLMLTYPSLRVAYIHAALEPVDGKYQKVYYSVLVKGGDSFEEEIYRIKLPGPPTDIGEAKAENQNHAIIFTRGEALQKIDTNQDSNFGEAFKLRNVLEEFKIHHTNRKPTILGIRDRIFTGSVSSLSWLMSNQENSSATIGQRILANPLRVRFHYGRNDIFDRLFHITRGGVSKASKVINRVKDDVFAGFNSTLRGGLVTHHEYIQMGRWCDVGINQISLSDTTDASGNGEQTLSRDVHRLGRYFDFFRMLSLYYTTVGFYFSSVVAVVTVYVFLYGRLYIIMSGAEKEILKSEMIQKNMALVETLATQFVIQMGLFLTLPMVIEMGLEKAFRSAFGDFVFMQLQLAPVFFTFRMGTKAHHYEKALLYGTSSKASIRSGEETATTFVVTQATFSENYRLYSRSHFVKGLELLVLLIVCHAYGDERRRGANYVLSLASDVSLWLLVVSWLFAPFLFSPSCFNWPVTVEKWREWESWLENEGGIGVAPEKSWESWWEAEHEHLNYMSLRGKSLVIFLALRFFAYQYGIVYHLNIAHRNKGLMVYGLSWVFTAFTLLVIKISFTKTKSYKAYNIYKAIMYFAIIAVVTDLFLVYGLTVTDVFASLLAFLPSAWAFVLIGQVCRALSTSIGVWESVKELAKACDFVMGSVIFGPVAVLSWFSIVSKLQKRLLFYQEFIRGF